MTGGSSSKSTSVPKIVSIANNKDEIGSGSEIKSSKDEPPEDGTCSGTINLCGLRINKATLPLKATLFLYYGAMAAILPYLTIHMLNIGISISETAIIYGVLPFTSFIGPPLIGFLADNLGQYKLVLIIATFSNAFFHTMLLAVPTYREISLVESVALQWNPTSNQVFLRPVTNDHCEAFMNNFKNSVNLTTIISSCSERASFFSTWDPSSAPSLAGFGLEGEVDGTSNETDGDPYVSHYIAGEFCRLDKAKNGLLEFICSETDLDRLNSDDLDKDSSDVSEIDVALRVIERSHKMNNCSIRVVSPFAHVLNASTILCQTDLSIDTGVTLVKGNNALTFWLYFLIRIIATIFMSSCFSLLDATTLAIVKKTSNAEYGAERIWTVLGTASISPIAGLLVDWYSQGLPETDYSAAFYVSDVLFILNIISYLVINLDVDKPEKNFIKDGKQLFQYPEVVVFLIMIFILGNMWGFVESYLFVFLKDDLNAPNYLLGLTLTTGSLTGIPFLYGAERIVAFLGRVNVIILAFLFYFVRFFGYSYIWSPWLCFPMEALEAFTYHLMWTAAATYCSILAPKGLLATLMGIMGALHYSLGKGFGSFIGGYIINLVGVRRGFRDFGIASGVVGLIYFIINAFWIKKIVRKRLSKVVRGDLSSQAPMRGHERKSVDLDANANASTIDDDVDQEEEEPVDEPKVTDAMLSITPHGNEVV